MFNAVFHSPYFDDHGNGVLRGTIVGSMLMESTPRSFSFSSLLQIPFLSLIRDRVSLAGGLSFRDVRLGIAIALALLVLALWLKDRLRGSERAPRRALAGLSSSCVVGSYASRSFRNYRYLGVVECVSGVVIVLALGELVGQRMGLQRR